MQVVVIGTLDEATATIHVSQMFRALPPKVMQAETVAIVCDACLRDMAEAKPAALKALEDWGRFEVRPNPKHVDLIFLLSANPYLGDYVTRDGPDTRPVHVDVTFMNVIDPRTGESLWGDSRQWGSWFVARATKDLMAEFREQLEAGDHHAARLLFPRDGTRGGESRNKSSLTTWLRSSNAWIATRTENSTITSYNSCVCQTWIEHVFTFSLSILRYASVTQAIQMHRP
jgi:hypothetical protein